MEEASVVTLVPQIRPTSKWRNEIRCGSEHMEMTANLLWEDITAISLDLRSNVCHEGNNDIFLKYLR